MITRENLHEVVEAITAKDKKRIKNTDKEFCVLILNVFNAGFTVSIILTDHAEKYYTVSDNGNAMLYTTDVLTILNRLNNDLLTGEDDMLNNALNDQLFDDETEAPNV